MIACLAIIFRWIVAFFRNEKKPLFDASFAEAADLKGLQNHEETDDTSLILGVDHFKRTLRVRPTKKRRELGNLLVIAPTRGGKGLLAISQLLTWPHSVIVNDIKGELYKNTAGYRSTLGKVFVIDPRGVGHRFDPLNGKQTEDELFSAATHLLYKPDEGQGAIFTQRATDMLTQIFLAAMIVGVPPLPYARYIIRLGLIGAARQLYEISPELTTQFLYVELDEANFEDRFLLSAWGTLTARMRPTLTENVVKCFNGTDFTVEEIMTSKKLVSIYMRWPEQDLLALSPLVRLFGGTFTNGLITTYDRLDGKNCNPVLYLADEAGRTAIPSLADHATTVVGRDISLWIAIQDLSQLETIYGAARAKTLRNNCDSQIFYRPYDQDTAEFLERRLNKKSEFSQSQTRYRGKETSEGLSEQGVPLMRADKIMQLDDEEIIGFHRNLKPFKEARMDWRHFPTLVKRRCIKPPPVFPLSPLDMQPPTVLWAKTRPISINPDRLKN